MLNKQHPLSGKRIHVNDIWRMILRLKGIGMIEVTGFWYQMN